MLSLFFVLKLSQQKGKGINMKYDKTNHRWSLEVEDCATVGDVKGIYGGEEKANIKLAKQSATVYRYIYNRIPGGNHDIIELTLAKDTRFLQPFKEALLAQLQYDISSGGDSVDKQVGLDFKSGMSISRSLMRERQVAIETIEILEQPIGDMNLLYAGDYGIRLSDTRYADYDY